jgi:hypothetical protein
VKAFARRDEFVAAPGHTTNLITRATKASPDMSAPESAEVLPPCSVFSLIANDYVFTLTCRVRIRVQKLIRLNRANINTRCFQCSNEARA